MQECLVSLETRDFELLKTDSICSEIVSSLLDVYSRQNWFFVGQDISVSSGAKRPVHSKRNHHSHNQPRSQMWHVLKSEDELCSFCIVSNWLVVKICPVVRAPNVIEFQSGAVMKIAVRQGSHPGLANTADQEHEKGTNPSDSTPRTVDFLFSALASLDLCSITKMAPNPKDIVARLLENTSNIPVMEELIAADATYISLCYSNPPLHQIMAHAGQHSEKGPQAVISTFANVNKIWAMEDFEIQSLFGEGPDVAVFGSFTLRSRVLGKAYTSPFSVHCKVEGGQVTYMLFMEDTVSDARIMLEAYIA